MSKKKKPAHGAGIAASRDVDISDISGRVAVGEHIYQVSLIYNDYRPSLEKGKTEGIPKKILEQLNFHLSKIKEAESQGNQLSSDAYHALALSAYWKRDFLNAEIYLIKAADKDPSNFKVRNLLCTIYHTKAAESSRLGQRENAVDYARRTESYFPYNSIGESLMLMGFAYYQMYGSESDRELLEKGKARFEMVLALDCSDQRLIAGSLCGLGSYYKTIGDTDMAIKKYLEALKISPKYAGAHYQLASSYDVKTKESKSDQWRLKAIEQWKKFLSYAPNDPAYSKKDVDVVEKWIKHLLQSNARKEG